MNIETHMNTSITDVFYVRQQRSLLVICEIHGKCTFVITCMPTLGLNVY